MPVVFGVDEILSGVATAVIAPATTKDNYKHDADDDWHHIDDLPIGEVVHEVKHFGMQTSRVGEVINLSEIGQKALSANVMITEIRLIRANELTEAERAELGSGKTSKRIGVNMVDGMKDRRGWFMRVMLVDEGESL